MDSDGHVYCVTVRSCMTGINRTNGTADSLSMFAAPYRLRRLKYHHGARRMEYLMSLIIYSAPLDHD